MISVNTENMEPYLGTTAPSGANYNIAILIAEWFSVFKHLIFTIVCQCLDILSIVDGPALHIGVHRQGADFTCQCHPFGLLSSEPEFSTNERLAVILCSQLWHSCILERLGYIKQGMRSFNQVRVI